MGEDAPKRSFSTCKKSLLDQIGAAESSMLRKLSGGVVFIGGNIFGAELTGPHLALLHKHVS
jgi:hypothetical protein